MKKKEQKHLGKTDQELVKLSLSTPNEYSQIIKRYETKLAYYIRRIVHVNAEDLEDILQEVFIKVYRNLNAYNEMYKFSSWIYRIAHNEAITYVRAKKIKGIVAAEDSEDSDLFESIASNVNIEEDVIKEADKKVVHDVLDKLEKKYRTVLVLKFIEQKDYNEISDILQIPSGTVGSLINRAKAKFKVLMEKHEKRIR